MSWCGNVILEKDNLYWQAFKTSGDKPKEPPIIKLIVEACIVISEIFSANSSELKVFPFKSKAMV